MKVGILCAGDTEFLPFQKYLEEETVTKKAMLSFHQGKIGSVPVVALYSGVCKVNAAIAAQLLIDVFQTDVIINAGTAGGIDEGVRLFDTVVADGMAYHDVADDILTEFHPWLPSIYFAPSQKLLELMRTYSKSVKYRILFGTAVTGEAFVENDRRRELRRFQRKSWLPLSDVFCRASDEGREYFFLLFAVVHFFRVPLQAQRSKESQNSVNMKRNTYKIKKISLSLV